MSTTSVQEARQSLGRRLREIRMAAGLTGRDLAIEAGWHSSKVSRIEYGKQTPSADDIRSWCRHCHAPNQVSDLLASMQSLDGMYVELRRMISTGLKRLQQAPLNLFHNTKLFRMYEPGVIPGLLQTQAYAQARMQRVIEFMGIPNDLDEAVAARINRQNILNSGDHHFVAVLEEWALKARIGSKTMMADQLEYLWDLGRQPNISLAIIPANINRTMWPSPGFWIFDHDRVLIETPTAEITITQPREISIYIKTFNEMLAMTVRGNEVRALIDQAQQTP